LDRQIQSGTGARIDGMLERVVCPTLECAARLAGASDETIAAIGVHIQADEAEKRARTIAALEETLGAEASADLHASGRAMPASEALQAARGVVVGGAAGRR
jgi:hypothetical protein